MVVRDPMINYRKRVSKLLTITYTDSESSPRWPKNLDCKEVEGNEGNRKDEWAHRDHYVVDTIEAACESRDWNESHLYHATGHEAKSVSRQQDPSVSVQCVTLYPFLLYHWIVVVVCLTCVFRLTRFFLTAFIRSLSLATLIFRLRAAAAFINLVKASNNIVVLHHHSTTSSRRLLLFTLIVHHSLL